ncbi:hypothetical protein SCHPADRAFT_895466 [Schizopora paradoxa]|uniref:Uncharacterized protein n=1 Tax=Schizopora paradoxa TaxID=27342 RepID=A0A0H2R3M4_9AGAM|nr:hypothetical protein SCHPADRAFT_895466 [Schizopora paradoxa]
MVVQCCGLRWKRKEVPENRGRFLVRKDVLSELRLFEAESLVLVAAKDNGKKKNCEQEGCQRTARRRADRERRARTALGFTGAVEFVARPRRKRSPEVGSHALRLCHRQSPRRRQTASTAHTTSKRRGSLEDVVGRKVKPKPEVAAVAWGEV